MNQDISNYTKNDIDKGYTPPEIYKLCSCIRETFCLSYSIRKNNNLFLFFLKILTLVKFEGNRLRFLGSDERSQALLLLKAINKLNEFTNNFNWIKSTSGIFIRKFHTFQQFLNVIMNIFQNKMVFVLNYLKEDFLTDFEEIRSIKAFKEYLYILFNLNDQEKELEIINLMKNINIIKYLIIPKVKKLEDQILYINYIIER